MTTDQLPEPVEQARWTAAQPRRKALVGTQGTTVNAKQLIVARRLRPNAGLSTRRFGEYPVRVLRFAVLVVAACSSSAPAEPTPIAPPVVAKVDKRDVVAPLLGTTPPAWQVDRWLHSKPLSLAALRGKVVLVRWWTAGCPYCSTSAPALRTFHQDYGPKGLVVIGMYHHKDDGPFDPAVYEATATKYGFTFPLAFDPEWKTLHSWLGKVETGFTSVTFLLDKHGVIRHVHPGGEYAAGEPGYVELDRKITELLAAE